MKRTAVIIVTGQQQADGVVARPLRSAGRAGRTNRARSRSKGHGQRFHGLGFGGQVMLVALAVSTLVACALALAALGLLAWATVSVLAFG
jgi:hypothetical protein